MDSTNKTEGNLGKGEYKTTDIFKKSTKLMRSPLKKIGRAGSFSDLEVKICRKSVGMEVEENENKKRKREGKSKEDEEKIGTTMRKSTIRKLKERIIALRTEIDRDILRTVVIDEVMNEVMELVEQAEAEEMVRLEEDKDGSLKQRRKMNGLIAGTSTYEMFKEIEGDYWPKECFLNIMVKPGTCPTGEEDIVLWRSPEDPDMDKGSARRCRESFPELLDMGRNAWETLTLRSERISKETGLQERIRYIHIAEHCEGAELFKKLKELKAHLRNMGVKYTSMAMESHMNVDEMSKMMECVFRSTDVKITLYSPNLSKGTNVSQRSHQSNAIIINIKQGGYAETLKRVKEDLKDGGQDTTVKRIRSTRNGEMLIELREGDDGTKLESVLNKREGLAARVLEKDRNRRKKYIIRDLDAVITGEEVEEALKRTAVKNEEAELVKVLSLRSAYGSTQTAIVQVDAEHGYRLVQRGGIKFGVVQGILKEWVEVEKCFRCWDYGHRASECTGPDRSKNCLRCGSEGHEARDCSQEVFCPICQRQGHRAGSGACQKMREMLKNLRKKEGEKRKKRLV